MKNLDPSLTFSKLMPSIFEDDKKTHFAMIVSAEILF